MVSANPQDRLYTYQYGSYLAKQRGYARFRNIHRLQKLIRVIDPQPGEKILEIGCNYGMFVRKIAESGADVTGVDINKDVIDSLQDSRFHVMSGTDLRFADNTFNKIFSFEVIEHIPEIKKYFSETCRVLKPGGTLTVSFPWELIRGQSAIRDAIRIYKDIRYCRKLHVHKLTPAKVRTIINGIPFVVLKESLELIPFPSFIMTLQKKS